MESRRDTLQLNIGIRFGVILHNWPVRSYRFNHVEIETEAAEAFEDEERTALDEPKL